MSTLRSSEKIIDSLVDNLFRSSQLNKNEFYNRMKLVQRKGIDSYVQPFTLREEDRNVRTGLSSIMSADVDLRPSLPPIFLG